MEYGNQDNGGDGTRRRKSSRIKETGERNDKGKRKRGRERKQVEAKRS